VEEVHPDLAHVGEEGDGDGAGGEGEGGVWVVRVLYVGDQVGGLLFTLG